MAPRLLFVCTLYKVRVLGTLWNRVLHILVCQYSVHLHYGMRFYVATKDLYPLGTVPAITDWVECEDHALQWLRPLVNTPISLQEGDFPTISVQQQAIKYMAEVKKNCILLEVPCPNRNMFSPNLGGLEG